MMPDTARQYPIGTFQYEGVFTHTQLEEQMKILMEFPNELKAVAKQLTKDQLDSTYRENGWTGRQVVHHLADSHMHAYIRTKFALLEHQAEIKAYDEKSWANAKEINAIPISASLEILSGVHTRWYAVFKSMKENDFHKTYLHPEYNTEVPLHEVLHHYAWHSHHHLGHLLLLSQ